MTFPTRSTRRFASTAAAVSLLLATVGVAVAPAGAVNQLSVDTLALDCANPPITESNVRWVPTSLTVTMTNCDTYEVSSLADSTPATSGPGSDGSVVVAAGNGALFSVGGNPVYLVAVKKLYPETVPSGQLLATADATIPATAPEMNIGAPTTGGEHELGGVADCLLQTGGDESFHVYSTLTVDVTVAGEYTFRGIATDPLSSYLSSLGERHPIEDPFLALYSSFDPSAPDEGVVGCNDDLKLLFGYDNEEMAESLSGDRIMEGHLPYFVADLQPGSYTLVLTVWGELPAELWNGQGLGPASVTFEMWGPADGLCVTDGSGSGSGSVDPEPTPAAVPAAASSTCGAGDPSPQPELAADGAPEPELVAAAPRFTG